MELPDSFRNILGNGSSGSSGSDPDPSERSKVMDGGRIVAEGEESISIQIPEGSDVDRDQIEAALSGRSGTVKIEGQTGGDSQVTPVASGTDLHITDSAFDMHNWANSPHLDDRIQNLQKSRIDYNQTVAKWILSQDDLIPGILIRLKSLMLGDEGLRVEPEDPDNAQDQRLAEHCRNVYQGNAEQAHVDPQRVVDRILEQNVMNAVWVGRSTDLQHLDVDDLSYVKDGETGSEIYIQDPVSYTTFEVGEDGEPSVDFDRTEKSQALVIGEEVLDVRLYRNPPLESVADDVVNKLQMKRFQGRKAEIASIGGIIIKVNPPAWLDEEDYGNYIREEDSEFGDADGRLLELVMAQQIDAALETLEDYQTATVMSIPENWEVDTVELPEMNESMQEMIRGYNEAIARRLLLPLDLLELEKGSELSRSTMMSMFLNTMAGWQGQITDMFDQFSRIQADIHGMGGSVTHSLPQISAKDTQEILNLFNFAGLLGLTEGEARELANVLEGVDLDSDSPDDLDLPENGGPDDPEERERQMQELLDQNQDDGDDDPTDEADQMQAPAQAKDLPDGFPTTCRSCGNQPRIQGKFTCPACTDGVDSEAFDGELAAALSDEGAIRHGEPGEPICWVCGSEADVVNETPPHEFACSYHGISPNHVPIDEADVAASIPEEGITFGNVGGDPFEDQDTLEAFVNSLLEAGADTVWLGDEPWPDHSGIHDRPVSVSGLSMAEAQEVWEEFIDESAALGGPRPMQAQGVEAEHAFTGFSSAREAAAHVRSLIEQRTPNGFTGEIRRDGDNRFAIYVFDPNGDFDGSLKVSRDPTQDNRWLVTGGDRFFSDRRFEELDAAALDPDHTEE